MKKLFIISFIILISYGCKPMQSDTAFLSEKDGDKIFLFGASTGEDGTSIVCRFNCSDTPTKSNKESICSSPVYIEEQVLKDSQLFSQFLSDIKSTRFYTREITSDEKNKLATLFEEEEARKNRGVYDTEIGNPDTVCNKALSSNTTLYTSVTINTTIKDDIDTSNYTCYKADSEICEIEAGIFKETNAFRKSRGLAPLQANRALSYIARKFSIEKASGKTNISNWNHEGANILENLKKSDISSEAKVISGFNRAHHASTGAGWDATSKNSIVKSFINIWINSTPHMGNILSESKYLGVGVYQGNRTGTYYAVQLFAE